MRRYVNILVWLIMTVELEGGTFSGLWSTWFTPVSTFFFTPIAHVIPWDALVFIAWLLTRNVRGDQVPAVARSLKITALTLVLTWLGGIARGGSSYQVIFQLRPLVVSLLVASVVGKVYRTRADIRSLGRTIAFACIYRAFTAVAFWYLVAQHMKEPPIAMTEHTDTVLFVVGMFLFLVNAFERKTGGSIVSALLAFLPISGAIIVNNRRLAWLAVGVAFLLMYLLLPKGRTRKRVNRVLLVLSPLIISYIAVGWGNPTGIFKPVGSISTMFGEHQDTSSLMRDIENYNLMKTLKASPLLGFGWGREYIEELRAIDISSIFPQYRYLPHNSLLGAVAFTGMFGFAGIWQMVIVSVYLHCLVYRGTKETVPRIASMCSIIAALVIELQMWGDIGFNHPMVTTMLAITVGLSSRLPIITGVWAPPKAEPNPAPTPTEAGAVG